MSNPQQPEQRRSDKGGAIPQDSAKLKAAQPGKGGSKQAHGTDKGNKGGGEGRRDTAGPAPQPSVRPAVRNSGPGQPLSGS
ncbi:hypothetical protein GCM10010353_69140 [Streptomyces chryseus]|nr:hypothetical protein GCM10010353_69140 [Streptomyces chryseus]